MLKVWNEGNEDFYKGAFAYLKKRFNIPFSSMMVGQKNTGLHIYRESIIALENWHEVIRKVLNGSAPSREQYQEALDKSDDRAAQEVIDFYSKLRLTEPDVADALRNFSRYYDFDKPISTFFDFLDQGEGRRELLERESTFSRQGFESGELLKLLDQYKAAFELGEFVPALNTEAIEQDAITDEVLRDYNELVVRGVKFGALALDISLPATFRQKNQTEEALKVEEAAKLIARLQSFFQQDDGVLLVVNHAHFISNDKFVLSYLVIYKATVYRAPEELYARVNGRIESYFGQQHRRLVAVRNHAEMLSNLFPDKKYIGTLDHKEEKLVFRDEFLKYFLSSIFLLQAEQVSALVYYKEVRGLTLNNHSFYKDKLIRQESGPHGQKGDVSNYLPSVGGEPGWLDDLVKQLDSAKIQKYFSTKDLPIDAVKEIRFIDYLCRQQACTTLSEVQLGDLLRIEVFLSHLRAINVAEFSGSYDQQAFRDKPQWNKLSALVQQFLLVSQMNLVHKQSTFDGLNTHANNFIDQFNKWFKDKYRFAEISELKRHLEQYKNNVLKGTYPQQRLALNKAETKVKSIQSYLTAVLKNDVVVFRFIFTVGVMEVEAAEDFDQMFGDYVDSLKRSRRDRGTRLVSHVGAYIPHRREHYIDAALFFELPRTEELDIEALRVEVMQYWADYVSEKDKQQQEYRNRQKDKAHAKIRTHCDTFMDATLAAKPVPIVKTENSLRHESITLAQGQHKLQKLLAERLAQYYAYCHIILATERELERLPRKAPLILGRFRSKKADIVAPSTGDE